MTSKRIVAEESRQEWNFLWNRNKRVVSTRSSDNRASGHNNTEDDVFDCSDLVVPPTKDLVDEVLDDFVQQWKDLDERKVPQERVPPHKKKRKQDPTTGDGDKEPSNTTSQLAVVTTSDDSEGSDVKTPQCHHRLPNWGWHANRLRLPEKFDYATRETSPPPSTNGEQVISLLNPLEHVSYERELWKLFAQVPTEQELEQEVMHGAACRHSRKICKEITETLRENSRLDGHALSRMRHRDRHGLPPPVVKTSDENQPVHTTEPTITSIRMEVWRQQLKRGSSPDAYRMELEFLTSQTLLDVHKAIVELHQDDLWTMKEQTEETPSRETTQAHADGECSGLFFVEGTFYTTGSVDYAKPIVEWLNQRPPDAVQQNINLSRRYFLGIAPQGPIRIEPMKDEFLSKLSLRLGIRYHHVCHGDVECSVFVTDVRHTVNRQDQQQYPIVHDVWTPSYPMTECEACQRLVAAVVVPPGNEMTHGGATALCQSCFDQLFTEPSSRPKDPIPYKVFREQTDLSVGHNGTKAWFSRVS